MDDKIASAFADKKPLACDKVITVRLNRPQYDLVEAETGSKRGAIAALIREGIALALHARKNLRK